MTKQYSLDIKDLSYARADSVLFEHLQFSLHSGQAVQVVGPNGCGKTSLLRLICGLSAPDQGQILWCGHPISMNYNDYCQQLLYLGHEAGIRMLLTPKENLQAAIALRGSNSGVSVEQALDYFDLSAAADVPCQSLSAGQLRRCALAKCLVLPSKLWVLDEPFTALDHKAIDKTQQLMSQHISEGGLIVFSSHRDIEQSAFEVNSIHLSEDAS